MIDRKRLREPKYLEEYLQSLKDRGVDASSIDKINVLMEKNRIIQHRIQEANAKKSILTELYKKVKLSKPKTKFWKRVKELALSLIHPLLHRK